MKLPQIGANSVFEKEQKMYDRPSRKKKDGDLKRDPRLVRVLRGLDNEDDGQTLEERTIKAS